jgi:hypothetical protein
MKHTVTITFDIDTDEYKDIEDTEEGAVELARDMFNGDADLPNVYRITCGDISIQCPFPDDED